VQTDDRTICRYDENITNYDDMHGYFPYSRETNPSFNKTHIEEIKLTGEDNGQHTYYVACKNRAGDISQTSEISFEVDFFARGMIMATYPSGSITNQLVTLELETSKNANCKYREDNDQLVDFLVTGGTAHSSTSRTLDEGLYDYYVFCRFVEATDDGTISFIIDLTKPEVKAINISSQVCFDDFIQPAFVVDDELSDIGIYNYSLFEVGQTAPIIDWTSTTSDNPRIEIDDDLNLSFNERYYFKMTAADAAGNWGSEVTSREFMLIPMDSAECLSDDPPRVTILTNTTYKGVKVTMLCSDAQGCDGKFYGTSLETEDCNATDDYNGPVYLKQTSKFCWEVFDNVGNIAFGSKIIQVNDADGDGVPDEKDDCPDTAYGSLVDQTGCPSTGDDDNDRVPNEEDLCPNTPREEVDLVDADGCAPSERDTDGDGILDDVDKCPGTPFGEAADTEGCSDSQKDSDDDGMDDAWEKRHSLDPFNPADADQDLDGDGLTNYEEYTYYIQTGRDISPRNKDTDEDGWSDKSEIDKNYNPVDASSHPKGKALAISFMIIGFLLMLLGTAYITYMEITTEKRPVPIKEPPRYPQPVYQPSQAEIQAAEVRRREFLERQRRMKELERRRKEIITRRREEKSTKRSKFFDVFGKAKPTPKKPALGKIIEKEKLVPFAKTVEVPSERKEFEKLSELTGKYLMEKKKLAPLLKITKVKKKDEFERLAKLIESRIGLEKRAKELTPEQKQEIRDVFFKLSDLKEKPKPKKAKLKTTRKKSTKDTFKKLSKLTKSRKK
jgi:hypothetical protein